MDFPYHLLVSLISKNLLVLIDVEKKILDFLNMEIMVIFKNDIKYIIESNCNKFPKL